MSHLGAINNAIRLQVERVVSRLFTTRYGYVTSYNPNTYTVKCTIEPEGILTGDICIGTPWSGNGWGFFSPPPIGTQVSLTFIGGFLNSPFVSCTFFNNANQPLAVPSGELWIQHKNGGFFKLTNDGKVSYSDAHGASFVMDGSGNITSAASQWNHTGNVQVTGNVHATQTVTGDNDVVFNGISAKGHHHPVVNVQTGTSTIISGVPQ